MGSILNELVAGYGPNFPGIDEIMMRMPTDEEMRQLKSPIPALGRYYKSVSFMEQVTSGQAIGVKRFRVIVEYVIALSETLASYRGKYRKVIPKLTPEEKAILRTIGTTPEDIIRAELIESFAEHDTAAAGDYVKMRMAILIPRLAPFIEAVHFSNTSEDVMGNVFGMVGNEVVYFYFLPAIVEYMRNLMNYAIKYEREAFLMLPALTHQQAAEPTTLMKMIVNVIYAILTTLEPLMPEEGFFRPFSGKLSGAVGNLSCHYATYPRVNWQTFARKYVEGFGLRYEPYTDQCVSYANESIIFNSISSALEEIIKFTADFVRLASCPSQFFVKAKKKGVKGSSIMPNKYNAWASEGGIRMLRKVINNLRFLASELQQYPHQGDMGRSFLFRDIGNDFMPFFIAIDRIEKELNKYHPNLPKINSFIDEYPGMTGSTIQSILKREGISGDAYRMIQEISINKDGSYAKGKEFSKNLEDALGELNIQKNVKKELMKVVTDMKRIVEPSRRLAEIGLEEAEIEICKIELYLKCFQEERKQYLLKVA